MWRWRTASRNVLPTNAHTQACTRFLCLPHPRELLTFYCFWKKENISLWNLHFHMLTLAPRKVDNWADGQCRWERNREGWREGCLEKKLSHYWTFFSPSPPPLVISPSTSQPLVLLKRFTLASHFHFFCTTPSPCLSLVCTQRLWLSLIHIHSASPLLPLSPTACR